MTTMQYLEIMYNDSPNPCYFVNVKTKEVVFLNQSFQKKFHIYEEYKGKCCHKLLTPAGGECAICKGLDIKHGEFREDVVYSEILATKLRSNSTLITVNQEELLMTKFFFTASDENRVYAKRSFEKAMVKCFEILSIEDQNESINAFLQLLCKFYHCKIAYICEFDGKSTSLVNQYIWSDETGETDAPLKRKDVVSLEHFVKWINNDRNHRMINLELNEDYKQGSTEWEILKKYEIENLTLNKIWNKDGSLKGIVGISNRTEPIYDDRLIKAISRFVSEKFNEKSLVNALNSLNEVDLLTGFYNRSKYVQKISELHKQQPEKLGILFINLNGLRQTNEFLGFEAGDEQIKTTSYTLREFFHEDFYRISGDEFVAFVPDIDKDEFEIKVKALHKQLKIENSEASFAIGHSWANKNYSISELVKIADTVMIINKQKFYSQKFNQTSESTGILLTQLFKAISEDEFLIYLQPQVNIITEKVVGAEALIRRFDKTNQKMIFPDQFIPLYEKNSIIRHIDLFVVRKVCKILKHWQSIGRQIPISINLSRVTLMEHGIVQTITNILDEYQIPHDLIIIEITERIGIVENEVASTLVQEFKENGFKLSLDDFGCAYSNIVTLAQIEVDEVKVDKSLIDNVLTNEKNRIIVKNVLSMCNELKETITLAEGIETMEQADFLRSVNCKLGQGYLYSRPIPHEEFHEKYIK